MLLMGMAAKGQPPQPGQPNELPHAESAPPLTVHEKFNYRIVETFGARGYVGAAVSAAIGQAENTPGEWGQGVQGYATRYVSGFGGTLTRESMAFVMDTAFHEDSRYFPSKQRGFKTRSWNALKQTFVCKTDSGRTELAYSRIFSCVANAQLVHAWQPASNGSVTDGVRRAFIQFGSDAGMNLLEEFVPFTRPRSLRNRH